MRYRPRTFAEPTIKRSVLAAHLNAALIDVLHDETLTDAEKVTSMSALARLAGDLSAFWGRNVKFYGPHGERLWFRQCGLDGYGMPHPDLARRIAEVSVEDDGDSDAAL